MIGRDRNEVPAPPVLATTEILKNLRQQARNFFRSDEQPDRQRQFDFDDALLSDATVIAALRDLFYGRCAFCSRPLDGRLAAHRFRPPQGAVASDGTVQREYYYWLAHEWRNLYPTCEECAAAQGAKFPVSAPRVPLEAPWEDLETEHSLLLDPCADDPEQYLVYLPTGEVVSSEECGRITIDVFALNRSELVSSRQEIVVAALESYRRIVRAYQREEYQYCADLIQAAYEPSQPFAATHRQFVNQRVQRRRRQLGDVLAASNRSLADLVGALPTITTQRMNETRDAFFGTRQRSDDLATPTMEPPRAGREIFESINFARTIEDRVGTRSFAVRRVHIRNFKGLNHLSLDLGGTPGIGRWTVLLGENGVGKTSVLQAIAMALAGPDGIRRTGLTPRDVLRQGAKDGSVRVELEGLKYEPSFSFSRKLPQFQFNSDLAIPLAGYGATRLLSNAQARQPKFQTANIENLFNPFVALARTELWIPELSESDFDSVGRALIRLLDVEDENAYVERSREGRLYLVNLGLRVPLSQLSSGYQATAAMALDLMRVFLERWGSLEAAEGLVLVDEIEAHLHPRWQMRVVESFRTAFPRVQFVASSHSPLTLRGLRDGEAVVIEQRPGGASMREDLPPLGGMTVDQLLTSETFGLHSTIDPDLERDFQRYYDLLAEEDRRPARDREIRELRARLDRRRQLGETRRERLMLEAIDEFLAQERSRSAQVRPLPADLRERLAQLWAGQP